MKKTLQFLFKVLLASLVIFLAQNLLWQIAYLISGKTGNLNNFIYSLIFLFFYFFIFYYLFVLLYSYICVKMGNRKNGYLVAQIFGLTGYIIFRFGDIIDGDFIKNFIMGEFISFLVLGLVLAYVVDKIVVRNR